MKSTYKKTTCIVFLLFIVFYISPILLFADAIRLNDGTIYLGKVNTADSSGIIIESFGTTKTISQSDILKVEKDIKNISQNKYVIELKDKSFLKGTVQNYDDEIGLLVMTEFGSITIASKAIEKIVDTEQKRKMMGYDSALGVHAGIAIPNGSVKNAYNTSFISFHLYYEHNFLGIKNFFIGLDCGYKNFEDKEISDITYDIVTAQPYLSYYTRVFRSTSVPFINDLVPFITGGGGLAFVTMHDKRDGGEDNAELVPVYSLGAGIDYVHFSPVDIRLLITNEWIVEKSKTFSNLQINLGVKYGF